MTCQALLDIVSALSLCCILYIPTNAAASHSCRWLCCWRMSATQISFKLCAGAIGGLSLQLLPTRTEAMTPWGCFPGAASDAVLNWCHPELSAASETTASALAPSYPTSLVTFFSPVRRPEPLLPILPFPPFLSQVWGKRWSQGSPCLPQLSLLYPSINRL